MEERATYKEIRSWLSDSCFEYCRGKLLSHQSWATCESEQAFAYDELSTIFSSTIENLMLEVTALILNSGRLTQSDNYHRGKIDALLDGKNLNDLLANMPPEESEEFLNDMKILNLIH
ncbi:MAG: hypothetical protein ACRYGK_19020 [Janthinobacterium lividum]